MNELSVPFDHPTKPNQWLAALDLTQVFSHFLAPCWSKLVLHFAPVPMHLGWQSVLLPPRPHSSLPHVPSTFSCPCCGGILQTSAPPLIVANLLGGPTNVSQRACMAGFAPRRLVWHSIAHSALPDVLAGRNGNFVSLHSLSLSPNFHHPPHFPGPSRLAWRPMIK